MKILEKNQVLNKIIEENSIVIILYSTNICKACSSLEYKLDRFLEKNSSIKSIQVPLELFPYIASQKEIFSAPTIEVYIENKLTTRKSGYFSLEEIFDKINRYIKLKND